MKAIFKAKYDAASPPTAAKNSVQDPKRALTVAAAMLDAIEKVVGYLVQGREPHVYKRLLLHLTAGVICVESLAIFKAF